MLQPRPGFQGRSLLCPPSGGSVSASSSHLNLIPYPSGPLPLSSSLPMGMLSSASKRCWLPAKCTCPRPRGPVREECCEAEINKICRLLGSASPFTDANASPLCRFSPHPGETADRPSLPGLPYQRTNFSATEPLGSETQVRKYLRNLIWFCYRHAMRKAQLRDR